MHGGILAHGGNGGKAEPFDEVGNGKIVVVLKFKGGFPTGVAPKEFVCSFAYLGDDDAIVAGQFGDVVNGHADRVGNGLVLEMDHLGEEVEEIVDVEKPLVIDGVDFFGHFFGKVELVLVRLVIAFVANGKGFDDVSFGEEGCVGGGVDAA